MKNRSYICIFLLFSLFVINGCERKDIIAQVGDYEISKDEFEYVLKRKASLLGVQELNDKERRDLLNLMIERELLYQYAKRSGFSLDKKVVDEELKELKMISKDKKEMNFFKKEVERNLYIGAIRRSYLKEIKITDHDIRSYYKKNKNEFMMPEMYKVYFIQVKSTDALHLFEKFNARPQIFDKVALEDMPPDIVEMNRKASFLKKEDFPEEMQVFLKDAKVGGIYGPVKLKKGTFLFKLIDRKPSGVKSLSQAYDEIKHILLEERLGKEISLLLESLKKNTPIKIKTMVFTS